MIRHIAMLSTTANPTDGLDSTVLRLQCRTVRPSLTDQRGESR
jgi:hypothetical protein